MALNFLNTVWQWQQPSPGWGTREYTAHGIGAIEGELRVRCVSGGRNAETQKGQQWGEATHGCARLVLQGARAARLR